MTISGKQFQNLTVDAIYVYNSSNVTITGNDFDSVVGGIYVQNSTNVTVSWNRFRNIGDGTIGGGHSDYIQFNTVTDGYIGHNKGKDGNTEDMISIWQSGGSSTASPLVIEYNQLESTNYTSSSGSGIMLGDGGGSHMIVRFNTLLNPGNIGIGITSGTDIHVTDNTIYGAQRPLSYAGIDLWNHYPTACSGNEVARNQVKWYRSDGTENGGGVKGADGGTCGTILGWDGTNTNNWSAPLDPNTLHVTL